MLARLALAVLLGAASATHALSQAPSPHPDVFGPAQWITDAALARAADTIRWTPAKGATGVVGPMPLLRRSFTVPSRSPIRRAELVMTALGSYRVTINGHSVGDAVLTPDWTDYRRRIPYQTYDVTQLVRTGSNAIGVLLGEGWYGSPFYASVPYAYGPPPIRLLGVLRVTYADGRVETIATDSTWRSTAGPIQQSQIYEGETYDARALPVGWDRAGFDDRGWAPVRVLEPPVGVTPDSPPVLTPQHAPAIRRTETLIPVRLIVVGTDTVVYDLGQNMVGWIRLRVRGPAGATVQLRHAEVLLPDGKHLQRENLRTAAATDRYTLAGRDTDSYEPHFTYHGFRYVEVVTSPGVRVDSIAGVVVHTDAPRTLTFEIDHPKLSRLWQNIVWGFRGNLMSVPTDCPQRSERAGWLGDATAFWPTAVYLMDLQRFTGKWMQDLRDAQQTVREALVQTADTTQIGCFPPFAPPPLGRCGGPGWSDGGVLVPYAAYRQYGDTALVRAHWDAMERYMAFIASNNPTFRWATHNRTYGDWLPGAADDPTGGTLIATAFWAADAAAMRDMARGLGDRAAEARYAALYGRIRDAFVQDYVTTDGQVGEVAVPPRRAEHATAPSVDTLPRRLTSQTSYALALRHGLVPDSLRAAAVEHLVANIAAHDGHLSTGFVGTSHLLPVLSAHGRDDIAYQLLLNEDAPSWLHMVNQGGTTMWERWDGDRAPGTTSFNHYIHGAVGEWLVRYAVGITQDSTSTGFRQIVIRPHPDPLARLTRLGARYESPVGTIASAWEIDPVTGDVAVTVTIPRGQRARVDLPVRRETGYEYVSRWVDAGTHHLR